MSERVGFIGLGSMGSSIARNLLKAGYALHVYNRDARKAETLLVEGAQQGMRPAEVTFTGGIVMTMVADDHALEQVTLGPDGLLEHLGPGGIHVSMSTVSPALARRMTEQHAERDCTYVAAPGKNSGSVWLVPSLRKSAYNLCSRLSDRASMISEKTPAMPISSNCVAIL